MIDGSDVFALPPAAFSPSKANGASKRSSRSDPSVFFPASPTSPRLDPSRNANPPSQAGFKRPLEDLDLPPPPTRTRKIIQMKPKTQSSPKEPAAAPAKPASKGNTKAAANGTSPAASKKKQPSATSAAGRKIARKTAHSLIERRRRSKMNEEFSTLKNMIPACQGQEMHKLAILQVRLPYLPILFEISLTPSPFRLALITSTISRNASKVSKPPVNTNRRHRHRCPPLPYHQHPRSSSGRSKAAHTPHRCHPKYLRTA